MTALSIYCEHLAGGTARQKRRAWTDLILEGGLWRGCRQAVEDGAGLDEIPQAYKVLGRDWDRDPVMEAAHAGPEVVEAQIDAARRLIAAAAVALLLGRPDVDEERLRRWGWRAAGRDV